jgi:hypothetical protein
VIWLGVSYHFHALHRLDISPIALENSDAQRRAQHAPPRRPNHLSSRTGAATATRRGRHHGAPVGLSALPGGPDSRREGSWCTVPLVEALRVINLGARPRPRANHRRCRTRPPGDGRVHQSVGHEGKVDENREFPAAQALRIRSLTSEPRVGRCAYDVTVMTLLPVSRSATMSSVLASKP